MIDMLKLVNNAVASKPLIPIMTYLHFYGNRVQANNGKLCIDAPSTLHLEITVEASKFLRAVKLCKQDMQVLLTEQQKLSVKGKKFRALLHTLPQDTFPRLELDAGCLLNVDIIGAIEKLCPFISEDASRPWSQSVLFRAGYAYATNNIILARVPCAVPLDFILPPYAIEALINIGNNPLLINVTENYIGFHYEDESWLRSCNVDHPWPAVEKLIVETDTVPLPEDFSKRLEELLPFCNDPKLPIFTLNTEGVHTDVGDHLAMMELGSFPDSRFRAEPLIMMANTATHIDFTTHPQPCYFKGEGGLEGVLMGIR